MCWSEGAHLTWENVSLAETKGQGVNVVPREELVSWKHGDGDL